jgi:lipoprotein-anchoring transpeptidase ErfK/SrfK
LAWAEANDLSAYEKEVWVNAKGYKSKTAYMIWINLAYQRVNIFEGSEHNWELIRSCIVGTGGPGHGTATGVCATTYKQIAGWTTSRYTCRPVVRFREGTGYAFHSRLYYPGSDRLTDDRIGFPVSAGCIRMYDEDIWYIFDNIPEGTTVVIH